MSISTKPWLVPHLLTSAMNFEIPHSRTRRRIAAGLGAGVLLSPTWAQRVALGTSPVPSNGPNTSNSIGPFPEDQTRVIFFFQFNCGFSSMVHDAVHEWAVTLPKPIRFTAVHLAVNDDDRAAVVAHNTIKAVLPHRLREFERRSYDAVQGGQPYQTESTYANVIRHLGEPKSFTAALQQQTAARILRAGRLSTRYKVTAVPSFGIGGSLVLSANHTAGDYQALIGLVNGAVSRLLPGG